MKLSMNIIIKEFRNLPMKTFNTVNHKSKFSSWKFLNCLDIKLTDDLVYLTNYSYLKEYETDIKNVSMVILCETIEDELIEIIKSNNISAIVVFRENFNLFILSNLLNHTFTKYYNWDRQISEISLKGGTVQEVMDASIDMFDNPIIVSNRTFKIVAYSNNEETNNVLEKVSEEEKTVYSQKAIQRVINARSIDEENIYREVTLINRPNNADCTQYLISIFSHGYRVGAIAEFFTNGEPEIWDKELLEYFKCKIELLFENEEDKTNIKQTMYDYLLVDMLNDENIKKEEIATRSEPKPLKYEGNYRVYVIDFHKNSSFTITYVIGIMRERNAAFKVTIYKNHIVILHNQGMDSNKRQLITEDIYINEIINKYSASIGTGDSFVSLSQIKQEYNKARTAIKIGRVIDPTRITYIFNDYIIQYLMLCSSEKISLNSILAERIAQLRKLDNDETAENLNTLRVYLENERNVSTTAQTFFLHRNSVLYRINKIEEILDIDLNDFKVRSEILMAFQIMDLEDKRPLIEL